MKKSQRIRTIMHIDLDAFFASVEEALHPELKGKAVVVGGDPHKRGVVACPNYAARKLGIKTAMPLYQAYRLAPQAVFLKGSFEQYEKFSEEFFKILARFTESIEPLSLDEGYLDLTGFEHFWVSPEEAAKKIQNAIYKELEITASIGIASNKVCAKIASDLNKPRGITYIPWNHEKEFLAPLPINRLPGIGPRTEAVFREMDIHTIGQLASAPQHLLIRLFGVSGLSLLQAANGLDDRPVVAPGQAKSISRSTTFEFDTADYSLVQSTMHYLLERACKTLRDEKKQGQTVVVKVRDENFITRTRQKTLLTSSSYERDFGLTAERLLRELFPSYKKVRLVGVGIAQLENQSNQTSIFEHSFFKLKKIQEAIDSIRNRFGFNAVYSGRTIQLAKTYRTTASGYQLLTPALSR
jgi:DNA polymerase IV